MPSKGMKVSPAREKTTEIIALYRDGMKAKPIAKRLGVSPRITREILIEHGVYAPTNPGSGEKAKVARLSNLHSAMLAAVKRAQDREERKETPADLRAAMMRAVKRCNTPPAPTWMQRYHTDPAIKVKHLLKKRIRKVVTRGDKSASTMQLLGCSRDEFMEHLQRQFKPGMTWNNLGVGQGRWNIDHIIPCASFDLTQPEQQRRCFHYTNLRPMWAIANIRKGCRTPSQHQWRML